MTHSYIKIKNALFNYTFKPKSILVSIYYINAITPNLISVFENSIKDYCLSDIYMTIRLLQIADNYIYVYYFGQTMPT